LLFHALLVCCVPFQRKNAKASGTRSGINNDRLPVTSISFYYLFGGASGKRITQQFYNITRNYLKKKKFLLSGRGGRILILIGLPDEKYFEIPKFFIFLGEGKKFQERVGEKCASQNRSMCDSFGRRIAIPSRES
jgi:hypothetical protein